LQAIRTLSLESHENITE